MSKIVRKLTARQREIADLKIKGMTHPMIAERLGISIHTVSNTMGTILLSIGATKRTEFVARYKAYLESIGEQGDDEIK